MFSTALFFGTIAFAWVSGSFGVLLSAFNGEVNLMLDSYWWSTFISSCVSLSVIFQLALWVPDVPFASNFVRGWRETTKNPKQFVMYCSSPLQVTYLALSAAVPWKIGFALFFVILNAVQVIISLTADLTGILWTQKRPVFWQGYCGVVLVLTGSVVFDLENMSRSEGVTDGEYILNLFLAVVSGVVSILIPIVTIRHASYIGTFRSVAFNYSISVITTGLILLISWTAPATGNAEAGDWWKFLGGLFGASIMWTNSTIPKHLGFAFHYALVICGTLFFSMLFDSIGFMSFEQKPVSAIRLTGIFIVFAGVCMSFWNKWRGAHLPSDPEQPSSVVAVEESVKEIDLSEDVLMTDGTTPEGPLVVPVMYDGE